MLDTDRDLDTLPGFAVRFLSDAKRSGEPITISVNGKLSFAIDDDKSFRMLFDLIDRLEGFEEVRRGLKELEEGKGIDLDGRRAAGPAGEVWNVALRSLPWRHSRSIGSSSGSPANLPSGPRSGRRLFERFDP